jgi:hypothetical protein
MVCCLNYHSAAVDSALSSRQQPGNHQGRSSVPLAQVVGVSVLPGSWVPAAEDSGKCAELCFLSLDGCVASDRSIG